MLQVLSNLVENALRMTPPGGGFASSPVGDLRVETPGRPRSPTTTRAFERFYLHERYGKERKVGTGSVSRSSRADGGNGRSVSVEQAAG